MLQSPKLVLYLIALSLGSASCLLSCRDEDGSALDWFTVYKFPTDSSVNGLFFADGTAHARMKNSNENFVLSSLSLNDARSSPGQTLNQLYNNDFESASNQIGYLIYNDQTPLEGVSDLASRAHAKGILAFDDKNVVWLIHSVPKFPPPISTKKYAIASNQCKYGQSMICMSMPISQLDSILDQLLLIWPQFYDWSLPAKYATNEKIQQLINKKHVTSPVSDRKTLKTNAGQEFLAFHKTPNFNDDLYGGFVAKNLTGHVYTETWTNGVGTSDSVCACPYATYNINTLKTPYLDFPNSKDHSKLAIVVDKAKTAKYLCIGDINRQNSQFTRGGGTVCFNNKPNIAKTYYGFINTLDNCDGSEVPLSSAIAC